MTHVVYSVENTVYSAGVLFSRRGKGRMEEQREKETVGILCADNPAQNFPKTVFESQLILSFPRRKRLRPRLI